MQTKNVEMSVGLFIILSICAMVFIGLKVADVRSLVNEPTYRLYATFNNIGGLKVRSPVRIGGVVIGRVAEISLDPDTYLPSVVLDVQRRYDHIPDTSSLSIRTAGLLGEQFLALTIGFEDEDMDTKILKDGDKIQDTKSAMVLEDLIGQFLYKDTSAEPNPAPQIEQHPPVPHH